MGDPRKIGNKFQTPIHPWQKDRLDSEKQLVKIYGLKNKKELWKIVSKLKGFKDSAKHLVARTDDQAEKEREQLTTKLKSLNLIDSNSMDEILGLQIEQLLDRRLQTMVFKKGFSRSIKQARQMITHKHVLVDGVKVSTPSFIVRVSKEDSISFYEGSSFFNEEHSERVPIKKSEAKMAKEAAFAKKHSEQKNYGSKRKFVKQVKSKGGKR